MMSAEPAAPTFLPDEEPVMGREVFEAASGALVATSLIEQRPRR